MATCRAGGEGDGRAKISWSLVNFCAREGFRCCFELTHFASPLDRQFAFISRVINVFLAASAAHRPAALLALEALLLVKFLAKMERQNLIKLSLAPSWYDEGASSSLSVWFTISLSLSLSVKDFIIILTVKHHRGGHPKCEEVRMREKFNTCSRSVFRFFLLNPRIWLQTEVLSVARVFFWLQLSRYMWLQREDEKENVFGVRELMLAKRQLHWPASATRTMMNWTRVRAAITHRPASLGLELVSVSFITVRVIKSSSCSLASFNFTFGHVICKVFFRLTYLQAADTNRRGGLWRPNDEWRLAHYNFARFYISGRYIVPSNFIIVSHTHRWTFRLVGLPILTLMIRWAVESAAAARAARLCLLTAHKTLSSRHFSCRPHRSCRLKLPNETERKLEFSVSRASFTFLFLFLVFRRRNTSGRARKKNSRTSVGAAEEEKWKAKHNANA